MKHIQVAVTKDKVAVITIDYRGSSVNKVSGALLEEIEGMLAKLDLGAIIGLVIVSGKEDNFIVGADVDEVAAMKSEREIRDYISTAHRIINRIDEMPVPVVCCVHGNCLGGGLEVALAADYRIAADSTGTVLGLPEVMLGLLPAGGGTQRLPRLIGLRQALPMMLAGKNVRVRRAKKLGPDRRDRDAVRAQGDRRHEGARAGEKGLQKKEEAVVRGCVSGIVPRTGDRVQTGPRRW